MFHSLARSKKQAAASSNTQFVCQVSGPAAPRSGPSQPLFGHDFSRVRVHGMPASLQRKTEPPKVPVYAGCSAGAAADLESNPHQVLERARVFAHDLVDAALAAIEKNDASEPYRTALSRHFLAPTFDQLKDIYRSFRRIWFSLKPENIRCASSAEETDECVNHEDTGAVTGFIDSLTSVVCPSFWAQSLHCKAITLIHEAAHGRGMGMVAPHPPYRGMDAYPSLGGVPSAGETSAKRMGNPDAFAFFAAHIGRGTDDACPAIHVITKSIIRIEDKKPDPGKK